MTAQRSASRSSRYAALYFVSWFFLVCLRRSSNPPSKVLILSFVVGYFSCYPCPKDPQAFVGLGILNPGGFITLFRPAVFLRICVALMVHTGYGATNRPYNYLLWIHERSSKIVVGCDSQTLRRHIYNTVTFVTVTPFSVALPPVESRCLCKKLDGLPGIGVALSFGGNQIQSTKSFALGEYI